MESKDEWITSSLLSKQNFASSTKGKNYIHLTSLI